MNNELVSGIARYVGNNPKLLRRFGRGYHVMYNSEGDYVRTKKGKQIVLDNDWQTINTKTLIKMNFFVESCNC